MALVIFSVFAGLAGCSTLRSSFHTVTPYPDSLLIHNALTWKLVWSDEFDYKGFPDPSKWGYETGYVRNNELQYYTESRSDNVKVENGLLIIETKKESFKGFDYTSASLTTKYKESWLYGRVEIRAKLPTGKGMWPTIWMLGSNIDDEGWPACGEIDIMENVGFDPDKIYVSIHTQAYNSTLNNQKSSTILVPHPYRYFHVYTIEWFEDRIDFYIDDKKCFTFRKECTGFETWPFDKAQYLIINAAVGGNLGGAHGVDGSIFPQKFYIDYVRVYKNDLSEN